MDSQFPCSLTIHIPFPTHRLAKSAIRTLAVDEELSQLVKRSFSLVGSTPDSNSGIQGDPFRASLLTNAAVTQPVQAPAYQTGVDLAQTSPDHDDERLTVLKTEYKATTNRMLRVAVNGFFESLAVVIQVMEELDADVLHETGVEALEGVQGVEQGMTGSTITGA